eukprot:gnl/MRDRNA2_/MRDRNA2_91197_c0_seq1.p2 gnl/MRDRNA2_/MRDRNA2_91197_c0~~gnl/MRDRNA2_/MRDRNA2_91197_c0_seq1.p2  ORF type:complete len:159 (-),score=66.43 gnl/MRDRNA2_/MRDRNA2_91197_c0_seq1:46-522(-)
MVIKTEQCAYTEYKIFPGRGKKFVAKDGKISLFLNSKVDSLFHQKIKPVKLTWTTAWRRMNKKGTKDDTAKKRTRKAQKFQKAIVGMSLDDIRRKKAQKPELRQAAKEAALKEAKGKAAKGPAKPGSKAAAKPKAKGKADAGKKAVPKGAGKQKTSQR